MPTITLYESNAGHLTMICGDRAFTGFEHYDPEADILADARALAAGETSDWTIDACDPEGDCGEPVATIEIAGDSTQIEFIAGHAGHSARRYVGTSADSTAHKLDSLDAFTLGFIECLLWQANDAKGEPLDMYSTADIDESGLSEIVQDCADFQKTHADLLEQAGDDNQNGHDFCLTRNGHGAGFWDRGYGEVGEALSDACKPYGMLDVYLGDDERIYVHN